MITFSELEKALLAACNELASEEKLLAALEMRDGQSLASVVVGSRRVAVTYLGRESGWMPRPVAGTQALRDAAIKNQLNHVIGLRSKIEGIRWTIKSKAEALADPVEKESTP